MDAMVRRRSVQPGASTPRDVEGAQQLPPGTVEPEGANFTRCDPVAIQCESARSPLHLSAAACAAPAGKRVLAQAAMVRIILRFLTARELLSFARTARSHMRVVAAELNAQYTSLFDEYRSLNSQFAVLTAGRPHVDQLRAIRDGVKALGIEMDDKLLVWEEIQHAWDDARMGDAKPVLTRDESYLGEVPPSTTSTTSTQSASRG